MSWESTVEYYRSISRVVGETLGGRAAAEQDSAAAPAALARAYQEATGWHLKHPARRA